MKKVISCCLATALLGSLGYLTSREGSRQSPNASDPPAGTTEAVAAPKGVASQLPRVLLGVGAAAAIVLPVGCGGGKGPTTPPTPPPRSFTVSMSREAVFGGTAGTSQHEVYAAGRGILEATLTADRSDLLLRAVSPSGQRIEGIPGARTLRIPAEPGRWVLSVGQNGRGAEAVGYQLRVVFP